MGAATHLSFSTQPTGYTSEGVLTTQPVVQALDASNAVDTTYTGVVTLAPSVSTSQFYTTTEKFKTTHTVQAGSTASALLLSPALTFDPSLPANYSGIHAGIIGTSGALNGRTGRIASNTGTTQVNMVTAFTVTPTAGDTVVIRSGVMFDSLAVTCVAGVATFTGLSISGHEATALVASASGLTGATSNTLSPTGTFYGKAELPRVTVDTTSPTYDPTVYTLNPANATDASPNWKTFNQCIADLTASDSAAHRLVLVQGATYSEFVTLKNRASGMGWITFRWNANPLTAGTRATVANMTGCPKITTKDNASGVLGPQTYTGSTVVHHYRFEGIELAVQTPTTGASFIIGQVAALWDGVGDTSAGMPHDLIFDQCLISGTTDAEITRGIYVGCSNFAFVNGSDTQIHLTGNDSQSLIFAGTCGAGHKVQNCYLESAGEIIMTGGGDTPVVGLVCSDVELRGNHFRRPLSWRAGWNGSAFTYTPGVQWETKNLLEFKSGVRWLVEGNVFENEWYNGQNVALVFGSASQSGTSPWQGNRDAVFRYNVFRNVCQWATLSGENDGGSGGACSQVLGRRVEVKHNVIIANNGDTSSYSLYPGNNPKILQMYRGIRALTIEHNTFLGDAPTGGAFFYLGAPATPDGVFQYNIASFPWYGAQSDTWFDDDIFANAFPGGRLRNVLLDLDSTHGASFASYTATNATWAQSTKATIGFADPTQFTGDTERAATFAQLVTAATLTSGSYAGTNWTGDGQNVGADMTAVASAIASAWVPGEGTSLDGVEPVTDGTVVTPPPVTGVPTISALPGIVDQWRPQATREGLKVIVSPSPLIGTGGLVAVASNTVSVHIPVGRLRVSVLSLAFDAMVAAVSSGAITVQVFKVTASGTATALTNATSIASDVITVAGNLALPILASAYANSSAARIINGALGDFLRVDIVAAGTITTQPQLRVVAELAVTG